MPGFMHWHFGTTTGTSTFGGCSEMCAAFLWWPIVHVSHTRQASNRRWHWQASHRRQAWAVFRTRRRRSGRNLYVIQYGWQGYFTTEILPGAQVNDVAEQFLQFSLAELSCNFLTTSTDFWYAPRWQSKNGIGGSSFLYDVACRITLQFSDHVYRFLVCSAMAI